MANYTTTHGCSRRGDSRLYFIHHGMMRRCLDERHQAYANYGGRGITVCREWQDDVAAFCKWAKASGYQPGLTLDRRDTNAGYSPGNCRWITKGEQNRNRRDNVLLEAWGEAKLLGAWLRDPRARVTEPSTVRFRIKRCGWSVEDALAVPPNGKRPVSERIGGRG